MALIFIGLPFVVRTVEPVLQDLDAEIEEAAATLGARRWQAFCRVILPTILPALLTGFALAFARGLGEYGSVIFIAGNMPMVSEIVPLLIVIELEQYDYAGATVVDRHAGRRLPAPARDQPAAALDARAKGLTRRTSPMPSAALYRSRVVTADRPAVRAVLIATALAFLGLFLLLPLLAVFVEALRQGLGAYLAGITEPDALAAIRLTLWSRRSPCP